MRNTKVLFATAIALCLSAISSAQTTLQDAPARLVFGPRFEIRDGDRAAGIEGEMKIGVEVKADGSVARAWVFVGPSWPCSTQSDKNAPEVMRRAEEAVKKFRFEPKVENGKPVASRLSLGMLVEKAARDRDAGVPEEANSNFSADADPGKHLSGGVVNGRAIRLVKPTYPLDAAAAHLSGTVSVRVLIAEDGHVIRAQATEGPVVMHFNSRAAACASRFSPTSIGGQPVKVSGVITYAFAR